MGGIYINTLETCQGYAPRKQLLWAFQYLFTQPSVMTRIFEQIQIQVRKCLNRLFRTWKRFPALHQFEKFKLEGVVFATSTLNNIAIIY